MAINAIKFIEDSGVGLNRATTGFIDAARSHNNLCLAESSLETNSAFSQLLYYIAWIPNKIHTYNIYPISGVTRGLAFASLAANALKLGKEVLSFTRQQLFLRIFTDYAWKPEQVVKTLTKISKLTPEELPPNFPTADFKELFANVQAGDEKAANVAREQLLKDSVVDSLDKIIKLDNLEIERALPQWLFKEITDKGGKEYFKGLLAKVNRSDQAAIQESVKILETMRSYTRKKTILHVLGIISAIVGIVGSIGICPVAFPLLVTILLLALVGVIGISTYAVNNGYVENPDGGFSLDRCIPEFMKSKADPYNDLPPSLQRVSALVLKDTKKHAIFDFSRPEHKVQRPKRGRSLKVSSQVRQSSDPIQHQGVRQLDPRKVQIAGF
jgi:hypothetical protein